MAISPPAARGDIKTLTKNEAFKIISVFFKTLNASTTFFHPPFRIFLMLCLRTFNTISTSSVGGGGGCAARLLLFFPYRSDHERDWPAWKVVFRVGNQGVCMYVMLRNYRYFVLMMFFYLVTTG